MMGSYSGMKDDELDLLILWKFKIDDECSTNSKKFSLIESKFQKPV